MRLSKTVSITLPYEMLDRAVALAKIENRTMSELIREALRRANGNKSQAARLLGLSRNALRYRLSKIGVPDAPENS